MLSSYEKRESALGDAERRLREGVTREHGSPFIAHHDLSESLRMDASCALITEIDGDIDTFLDYVIKEYPHLAIWTVATAVADGYGAQSDFAVYPLIAKRLGLPEIPSHRAHRLNESFRSFCGSIGLTLPMWTYVTHDWIGDYLFQAGVPADQLAPLARAFLHAEQTSGLPSLDDTANVNSWEDAAMEFAPKGLTRLRTILRDDPTGYHAAAFLRMRTGATPATIFEQRLLDAIEKSGGRSPAFRPPSLTFSDGELLIVTSRSVPNSVEIGTRVVDLGTGESAVLPRPWPLHVRWRPSVQDAGWKSVPIFSDPQCGILVFDGDSGSQKGELKPAGGNEQRVPGGEIALVSTQPFQADGVNALPHGDGVFILFCCPTTTLQIRQGDTSFRAAVDPRPHLEVDGLKVARNADGWLLAEPGNVRLRGELSGASARLEIRVEHPGMAQSRRVSVREVQGWGLVAHLDCLPRHGPFGLARVSVHVRNQNRALYRHRFWYWPSLKNLQDDGVFDAVSIPDNLAGKFVDHVTIDSAGRLCLRQNEPYLRACIAFKVDRQVVRFTFPPPGVSMFVRTSTGEESPLAIGARLEVARDQFASHVVVRCPDQSSAIDCMGEVFHQPFDKFGLWRRSFAALSRVGAHNVVSLIPDGRPHEARDLFRVGPDPKPSLGSSTLGGSLSVDDRGAFEKLISVSSLKSGRHSCRLSYTALVLAGNRDGRVGYGVGTGNCPAAAMRMGAYRAQRAVVSVPRCGNTIPTAVEGAFNETSVMLEPAPPGTGIVVRGPVRTVMEGAGISDVRGELRGAQSAMDVVRAVFAALSKLADHDESPPDDLQEAGE